MKDLVFIQRNWKEDFFAPLAVSAALDPDQAGAIKYEIGKEVEWLIRVPDPQDSLNLRISKINTLLTAYKGDIGQFDVYYSYRLAFFNYALEG